VSRAARQEAISTHTARLLRFFDHTCDHVRARTAYRYRAYPDQAQPAILNRTFGCVRWCPSSKTCSECGHLLASLSLSSRHWTCPSCRVRHDRDINVAKNILAAGLAVSAYGAGIGLQGTSLQQPAVKQELQPVTAGIPIL
jgi:Putative transposase DNA-binding domain/Helix-turn-helix domain